MMIPNTTGLLARQTGKDIYAQSSYAAPVVVPCAVVNLNTKVVKTPVRADSSATRGNAEEEVSVSKILFPKTVALTEGDKFIISGVNLRIIGIRQQNNVLGQLDHFEVDLGMWQR
jgi:hypothetical protein